VRRDGPSGVFSSAADVETCHGVAAAVSGSISFGTRLGALGLLLAVGACASACAGEPEAGTTKPQASTTSTDPPHRHMPWTQGKLQRRLSGETIVVGERRVRLGLATLTCGGDGPGQLQGGVRTWTHFSCIQPTFPPGELAGPDALFRVHVTGSTTFLVSDASFSS
jgi:hypothetical protein